MAAAAAVRCGGAVRIIGTCIAFVPFLPSALFSSFRHGRFKRYSLLDRALRRPENCPMKRAMCARKGEQETEIRPEREELPFCRENCYALRGPKGVHSGMQIALFSCILCDRHFPSSSVHQAQPPCVKLRQASGAGNDATTTNNFNSFSWHQT